VPPTCEDSCAAVQQGSGAAKTKVTLNQQYPLSHNHMHKHQHHSIYALTVLRGRTRAEPRLPWWLSRQVPDPSLLLRWILSGL
jgi:hypothetical protein